MPIMRAFRHLGRLSSMILWNGGGERWFGGALLELGHSKNVCFLIVLLPNSTSLMEIKVVDKHLSTIVPTLMNQFSSRAAYKFFDDALPTSMSAHLLVWWILLM